MPGGGRTGRIDRAVHHVDDGRHPIRRVQRGGLARQQIIAQSAQHHGQIGEQLLGGGIVEALAVAPCHRDQGVGGGAFGIEVVEGGAGRTRARSPGPLIGPGARVGAKLGVALFTRMIADGATPSGADARGPSLSSPTGSNGWGSSRSRGWRRAVADGPHGFPVPARAEALGPGRQRARE